jgi:hypothetical protein
MAVFSDRFCYWQPAKHSIHGRRESILWPVYAWKIVYPGENRRSGLDLFQQTILEFVRAGVSDTEELSRLMALDGELIRFILAQLQLGGYINERFKIADEGNALLDHFEDRKNNLKVGWAFQDAISGEWLPRFVENYSEIEPHRINESGRPVFKLDKDSGFITTPFILSPRVASKYDPEALFNAYRVYRRDLATANREGAELDIEVQIQEIERIEQEPVRLMLWCELYRDEHDFHPWLVSDPFRLRIAAPWFRKTLLKIAPDNKGLSGRMLRILPEVNADRVSAEDWLEKLDEHSELTLRADYPFLTQQPLIREHLGRILRLKGKTAGQRSVHGEDLGALMTESSNLIEAVLQWLLRNWRTDLPFSPRGNWRWVEAKTEFLALQLPCVSAALAESLAGQSKGQIHKAMKYQSSPLKGLLAACLFSANQFGDHPFCRLSSEALSLEVLPSLADYRNKVGGHASGWRADRAEVERYTDFGLQWMQLFKEWY